MSLLSKNDSTHRRFRFAFGSFLAIAVSAHFFSCCSISAAPDKPDFYQDVFPFLKSNCISCHNKTTTKAGLNMETPALMKRGGDSGPAIVPGDSSASLIVEASVHTSDMEMPPKNNKTGAVKLTPAEVAILKRWIDQGAKSSLQKQQRAIVWKTIQTEAGPIYSISLSEDERFAACARANRIYLYDLATRRFVGEISDPDPAIKGAHRALVHSLAFSPNGDRLASGGFRQAKIWKKKTGPGFVPPKHFASRHQLAKMASLSPGRKMAAFLTPDGKVAIVKTRDAALLTSDLTGYDARSNRVPSDDQQGTVEPPVAFSSRQIAWNAHNQTVITADSDLFIRAWKIPSDAGTEDSPVFEIKTTGGAITAIAASKELVAAAFADGKIRVFNGSGEKLIREIPRAGVRCLALSTDGKEMLSGEAGGVLRIWNLATGKQTAELRGNVEIDQKLSDLEWNIARQSLEETYQKSVATRIEAENKTLDTLHQKAKETVAAMTKKQPATEKEVGPAKEARREAEKTVADAKTALAKAPEDAAKKKALVAAQDKLITAQDKETGVVAALEAVKSNISDAKKQQERIAARKERNNKKLAATKSAAETAKAANAKATAERNESKKALTQPSAHPIAAAFSQDSLRVSAVFDDGSIRTWAAPTGRPLQFIPGPPPSKEGTEGKDAAAVSLFFDQGTETFAACQGRTGSWTATEPAAVWELERVIGNGQDVTEFAARVDALAFSPDGKILAAGGGEPSRTGDIALFETATGKQIGAWKERHKDTVVSLDFSHDGKRLASGSTDQIAKVTEVATGKHLQLFEGHTHHVLDVSFRADGRVLATAGADGAVNTWDLILGERKKKVTGWNKEVTSLQFIGATNRIVTSAGDNLIRIIDDNGRQVRSIANLPDFMQAAASSADGAMILGGGEDSTLRIWDGTNGKQLAAFGD